VSRRTRGEGGVHAYATKQGTRYAITYRVADPERGGTKQKRLGGFTSKRAALARLREVVSQVERGDYLADSTLTLREFGDDWLVRQSTRLRASTLAHYRAKLRHHVYPTLGALPLQQVTARHLDSLYARLLTDGRNDGQPLSAGSVRHVHVAIGALLSDAERQGLIRRSPHRAATIPTSRGAADRAVTWEPEQVTAFLTATADDRRGVLWRFLLATGTRRGEALGLRWADLDLDSGRCTITRSLLDVEHGVPVYVQPKTASGVRTIALDPGTIAALRTLRAEQAKERLLFGAGYADGDLVFCREDGAPYHPDRISKFFQERVAKVPGLPTVRLHDLRHTHATLGLRAGIQPHVMQRRLGHSHVSITLSLYAHASVADDTDAASTVAALFG